MTTNYARFLGVVAALCGVCLLSVRGDDDEEKKAKQKAYKETIDAIYKQADTITKKDWAAASREGEAVARKHKIDDIMTMMKLRKTPGLLKGVGVGPEPGAIAKDGIEAKLIAMSTNAMKVELLSKEQPALIRMAEITAAIASATVHQSPVEKKMGEKDPAKWKELMEEMHKSSLELIDALKKKNPQEVKKTSTRLRGTCSECHSIFRD